MSESLAELWEVVDEDEVEHIEIGSSLLTPTARLLGDGPIERRGSNRIVAPRIDSLLVIKQPFLGFWTRMRYFPCRVVDLSFGGLRIDSPLRIAEGEVVEIKLRGDDRRDTQVLPIRIICRRTPQDSTYGYGAELTASLDEPFRRLIISGLTQ